MIITNIFTDVIDKEKTTREEYEKLFAPLLRPEITVHQKWQSLENGDIVVIFAMANINAADEHDEPPTVIYRTVSKRVFTCPVDEWKDNFILYEDVD